MNNYSPLLRKADETKYGGKKDKKDLQVIV